MKAWVLHDIGDIQYEEWATPSPDAGEVLVAVKAAGICGSDIPRIYRDGAHQMPLVPGHEFAGQVVALGEHVDEAWRGKRVGVFPLIPCGECLPCQNKQYEMCKHYSYLGSRTDGGFAEYVVVPQRNLIALADNVSFEQAAMLEPMAVAVHAMRRIAPKTTDVVVVCGLGTIGMLLVMMLLEKGVTNILVIGNKASQKEKVLALGVPDAKYCDSKSMDVRRWVLEQTGGYGADAFFECVGKNETVLEAIDLAAPAGAVCLVGNPYSDMTLDKQTYWKILRNQIRLTGTWNSSFTGASDDDWHYVLDLLTRGRIHPQQLISHRFQLPDLEQGMHIMRDKSEEYMKVMAVI